MAIETKYKNIIVSGKRKSAVARAKIVEGKGVVLVNGKDYRELDTFNALKMQEPMKIAEQVLDKINFDVKIKVNGGGEKGQTEAARVALAKAIIEFTNSSALKDAYLNYDRNMLVADVRRKEACKPGDSKARSKRQSSKR